MSEKTKKPQKLRARLPRGFVDREAHDIRAVNEMTAKIREVYERYGFDPIETPLFEYTDALGKFLPDSDRPNEGVFSLQDDDEQWMSLRYDLTAPLARHVAENFNEIQLPYRTYRAGYVFRNEKPGPGRFRQFMQFDADSVGAPGVQADAEMCMMMADTLEALGIQRGDYVIRVNSRALLDAILKAGGINDSQKLNVLRSLDKFDKFGWEGVFQLLTSGRRDESGDFTKGADLSTDQAKTLYRLFEQPVVISQNEEPLKIMIGQETISWPKSRVEFFADFKRDEKPIFNEEEVRSGELDWLLPIMILLSDPRDGTEVDFRHMVDIFDISNLVRSAGYGSDRIKIDLSCVRGLEYYTGPVYEAELTFDVTNEKGEKVVFGSVGGGGRYDGLVSRFMGQPVPATGFSIGVSRLMTALKNLGKLGANEVIAPVLITVMDGDVESMGRYQRFTQALRNEGIRAEMYQGNWKKFGNQLKYADRRGSPIAIIQGGDEREQGVVQIKDLIEGKRLSGEITDNTEWREARVAQIVVPEAELVAKVKEILAAQAEDRARAK
ncbi:histidine--tRNA ligase [Agrobacterium vitis]|uniref:histidine--tRNA ligase n=1 Tax=Rhizobium/Agrobacterium group TaxID=227290 RepID=UPI0008DC19A1|nr:MULTISPECIES: HisS family protein [Rhizobium/Agrobacterium group]MCF1433079.1 histidine--tRNA ligase family protein [Allorhizobium ampelinum]MUO92354.1 histidine--tRNA ligase [Agrobacterium vitis]MUZ54842.1 histidine--tRNA ligase [Agrobacterium vitis]MUZ93864.1 histidine--tRNA ligase [Agrobacterium vitis]MVA41158.1 histidine--tRNA ligase [Agrobacterium vitis]